MSFDNKNNKKATHTYFKFFARLFVRVSYGIHCTCLMCVSSKSNILTIFAESFRQKKEAQQKSKHRAVFRFRKIQFQLHSPLGAMPYFPYALIMNVGFVIAVFYMIDLYECEEEQGEGHGDGGTRAVGVIRLE